MTLPLPGTQAHEEFLRRARDPNSQEAQILQRLLGDASQQVQDQVRGMLHHMIELVPGQLFRDIGRFHEKFALAPTEHPNHELPEDVLKFRIKFMLEELIEYCEGVGMRVAHSGDETVVDRAEYMELNTEKAFDSLIDLVYVALGTAYLHRFPFNDGWSRVQEANMQKVRAVGSNDPLSTRKHSADVVKPPGWQAPELGDLL